MTAESDDVGALFNITVSLFFPMEDSLLYVEMDIEECHHHIDSVLICCSISSRSQGTTYVYNSFLRPYVAKHETEIDRNLFEFKVKAREVWFFYWDKAVNYGDARFHHILQCVSPQEPSVTEEENLRKAEMVGSSKASLTETKQQLEQHHLPVSPSLSVSQEQSTTNDAQDYSPTYSTPSVANGNSNSCQELQTSYKGTGTKPRRIWRIFNTTKPHKNS
ncbi:HVA22-like protein i [Hibiscus syriacus]|uniref:HVA22-like protein i n=1 Tax=Hibiscus syriacus TaxID=106335 RepID=UPI0019233F05|nr:HVA22-like protein i [Hibiscus syriacus]